MDQFEQSLVTNMAAFELDLSPDTVAKLSEYYSLLTRWNERLHLVAPCSAEEFATRHVLESLLLLKHLPEGAKIADIGSGAGLPIIPCLLARSDLQGILIESSQKKSVFLREALNQLNRPSTVVPRRFEQVEPVGVSFTTCRALDQFTSRISTLINWVPAGSTLLLYGGQSLREQLRRVNASFAEHLIPLSTKRYLFVVPTDSEAQAGSSRTTS